MHITIYFIYCQIHLNMLGFKPSIGSIRNERKLLIANFFIFFLFDPKMGYNNPWVSMLLTVSTEFDNTNVEL